MRRSRITAAMLFAIGTAGCSNETIGPVCTADFRYGLSITVLDGSGAPAAEGAVGVATDGEYQETMMVFAPDAMVGAGERPGTYDIAISRAGYMTWSAENVTVTADECHVIPVSLEANLITVP